MAARKALTPFRMIQKKAHLHSQGRQAAPKSLRLVRNCMISSLMAQVGFMKGLIIKKNLRKTVIYRLPHNKFLCAVVRTVAYSRFQGRRRRRRRRKFSLRCYKLYRAFFILFNSLNVSQRFWTWILKDCIEVEEKKKRVVVLCSLNVKIVRHSHVVVVQRRQRNEYTKKRDARAKLFFC